MHPEIFLGQETVFKKVFRAAMAFALGKALVGAQWRKPQKLPEFNTLKIQLFINLG